MLQNILSGQILFSRTDISWPIALVVTLSMLGNNLFNKPALLGCILWFGYLNLGNLKKGFSLNFTKAYGIILFEVWAALSLLWTAVPSTTFNIITVQLSLLFLTLLISLEALDKNLAASLKISAYLIIAINVIFCIVFFSQAMSAIGLKGIYAQKNNFGVILAMSNLILLYAEKPSKLDYGFLSFGVLMLLLTQSKTSILIFFIIVLVCGLLKGITYFYKNLPQYHQGFIRLLTRIIPYIFYVLILLIVFYREAIASYLIHHIAGDFMTGRGLIWTTILSRSADYLLIGIGPGVYFESESASEILKTFLYFTNPIWIEKLAGADNGYVDIISSLGFIGLALLLLSFVQNYRLLFALKTNPNAPLIFALITFFILDNVSESTLYRSMNLPWILYLVFSFYLVHLNARQKKSAG